MGLRLSLAVAIALAFSACGKEPAAPAAPAAEKAKAPAKPKAPSCPSGQTPIYIDIGWVCGYKDAKSSNCDGDAPKCTNNQSAACGPERRWVCYLPDDQ